MAPNMLIVIIDRTNDWYYISPGLRRVQDTGDIKDFPAVIASELVPGALAQVTWEKACDVNGHLARFWRAIPPTSDYVALGAVGTYDYDATSNDQPPAELVARFRAVHKSALAASTSGVDYVRTMYASDGKIFGVDSTYWYADTATLNKLDCKRLDPKNVIMEDSKQFAKV